MDADRTRFAGTYSKMKLAAADLETDGPAPTWLTEQTQARMMKANLRAMTAGERTHAPSQRLAQLAAWNEMLGSIKPYPTMKTNLVVSASETQKKMRAKFRPKGRVPRNRISRTELEISITALEARRIELGAAFRNGYKNEVPKLDRQRQELLIDVRRLLRGEVSTLSPEDLERLLAVEAAASRLVKERRKTPYRHVVAGGLPTLGRGR